MSIEAMKLAIEALELCYEGKARLNTVPDAIAALRMAISQQPATSEPVVSRNPFAARCYTMSESHLSGHRLIVGFEKLVDAQDAHEWVTRQGRGDFTHQAPSVPDVDQATAAGLSASVGHLSRLVDEQTLLLARAMLVMKTLHESASPDDGPDMNAIIPAAAFREFVDADAALRHAIAHGPVSIDAAMLAAAQAQKGGA